MKKYLAVFAFCLLLFAFSPAPARAQLDCGDYGFEENGCCNYGDANLNLYHITRTDERCNSNWCERESFNDPTFPYTDCNYCHKDDLCMRKDNAGGCAGICDNVCCPPPNGDDGDEEEEEDCHMDDKNLTACCPVKNSASSLLEQLKDMILDIELPFSLTVRNFKVSKKLEEATDYYFGQTKTNGDGKEEIEEGVFFRLAPPNLLEKYFPNEGGEVNKRKDWAKWIVGTTDRSGGSGDDALNDGKLKNVEPYALAVENLRNFLVAIPKPESATTSQKLPETALAGYPSATSNPKNSGQILGATAAESCNLPLVEAETKKTCTPPDAPGKKATVGDLLEFLGGGLGLFPKIADLDKIGHYTAGVETDEEGWVRKEDPHYPDGGFLEIFKLPADPEYEDQNAKGSADLAFKVSVLPTINIGGEELKIRHQGSDTEAREKENGVWAKLTPPTAENGTTSYRTPTTPPIVLASNPMVQGAAYYPQNVSLAERIGQTLGTWLAKIITL